MKITWIDGFAECGGKWMRQSSYVRDEGTCNWIDVMPKWAEGLLKLPEAADIYVCWYGAGGKQKVQAGAQKLVDLAVKKGVFPHEEG